jgi:formate hydrogenlyase subunit 4
MFELLEKFIWLLVQALLMLALAPLFSGILHTVKAILLNRVGSSIFQPYFNIRKWMQKAVVITPDTSWVFLAAPFIYFFSVLVATAMLPNLKVSFNFGDIFVFFSILAFGRFFMTLSSLDAGTAFGGMGGSREIFISVLVEPTLYLSVIAATIKAEGTNIDSLASAITATNFNIATILACIAFFATILAENSRIPVDNPTTHLELTMIHETMVLEYSGFMVALIELASMLKMFLFVCLFSYIFLPLAISIVVKVLITLILIALTESLNNKMRLFKAPTYMAASIVLLILAVVAQ